MNRKGRFGESIGSRRILSAMVGTGLKLPFAPVVVLAVFFLYGCGSSMNVKVGGVETSAPEILGPVQAGKTGKPQLSFCMTKGTISNDFRSRNGSVRENDYYHAHLQDYLKQGAPFESIDLVAGNDEDRECDVLLVPYTFVYVTPLSHVEASMTVTAVTAGKGGKQLMTASVRDESSVDAAGAKVGRVVYNAFIPGSALYNQVAAKKGAASADFEDVVRRYRDMPAKPVLPEEARKYKIQAEAAINRKSFDEAAARYLDALKVAPWWPEGHFNRALILGETGRFKQATGEMRKYLMLVPEAPDARAAQDKIYEWEGVAGKTHGAGKNE